MIRIGTAGWAIPRRHAALFPPEGTHLARYAARLPAVEINSSFHRPHRPATYARWAAAVPPGFRFAVKLPRAISHDAKLAGAASALRHFADQVTALGDHLGPILVQLPPKLAFAADLADRFFADARACLPTPIVCEPRHPSWFEPAAEALLLRHQIARAAADPAPRAAAHLAATAIPGGWPGLRYVRLHGSPDIYRSAYGPARLVAWAAQLASPVETWCMFDNTTLGEAAADAATLSALLATIAAGDPGPPASPRH